TYKRASARRYGWITLEACAPSSTDRPLAKEDRMSQRNTTAAASLLAVSALMSLSLTIITGDSAFAAGRHLYKGRVSQSVATADRLLVKGKYAAAADYYRTALRKNPKDINAQVGLGMALTKMFKLDGAQEQFDKALARDPGHPGAHAGKAMLLL